MTFRLEHEQPGDELDGAAAAQAFMTAAQFSKCDGGGLRVRVSPKVIDVFCDGPWIAIVFRFSKKSLTWKVTRHWAHVLKAKLAEVLDK